MGSRWSPSWEGVSRVISIYQVTALSPSRRFLILRRLCGTLLVPVFLVGLLLAAPAPSQAASGGRIGGGSFRSAPSMPRSYGGGGGGYRGGYGGGYGGGMGVASAFPS